MLYKDDLMKMIQFLLPNEDEENLRQERALHLAGIGWSMPPQFSYKQIIDAGEQIYSDDEINEAMVEFFTYDGNSNLKELIYETIVKASDIEPWKNLIVECYDSFTDGKYLVVIPALLTVIEGYILNKVGLLNTPNTRLKGPTRNKAEGSHSNRIDKTIWLSVSTIIDKLYDKSDFSGDKPSDLNRHWILHGRSTSDEAKSDSVKLFNILGSLSIT